MNCLIWNRWSWQRTRSCQCWRPPRSKYIKFPPTHGLSQPWSCGWYFGGRSLQVLVCPRSIPDIVERRNALFYFTSRTSPVQMAVQWLLSMACSCLSGPGGSWERCLTVNYQRRYPGWGSLTWLPVTFSNKWQNGNFVAIATASYFLVLWFQHHVELCRELHSDCKDAGCLSALLVSSLAEVANAFQAVHWSYRTVSDSLGTRRRRKPRRNINNFTNLISLLALKKKKSYLLHLIYI